MKPRLHFTVIAALGLLLAGSGCSTFNLDWDAARALPAQPANLTGRWEGTWKSDANGHTDRLRCLITQTTSNRYEAHFHALYKKWGLPFTFAYSVPLTVASPAAGQWKFNGEAELGWYAGGRYSYTGQATSTNFLSLYECKYDRGTFTLARPQR